MCRARVSGGSPTKAAFHGASAVGLAVAGRRAMGGAGAAAQSALEKTSDDVRSARDEAASAGPDLPI
ncbi:MAG TPA: hypothetical protein VFM07_09800 [Intrasporangium sp.]|nr:hypothetical protein [Intrasporangium sp.]